MSSHVTDFNASDKILNLSIRAIGIISFDFFFKFKFYRRHCNLVSKFKVGLKSLLQQGLSEPELYRDLVYKLKKKSVGLIFLTSSKKLSCVTNILDIK